MRKSITLLLIVGIVGGGVALYLYLTRRKNEQGEVVETSTLKGNEWILSDALQANQLSSLTAQLSDKIDKADVLSLLSGFAAPSVDAYTKSQADDRYSAKADNYTKSQADDRYSAKADNYTKSQADDRYIAKIAGKGLSTNDYTDDHRTKLLGLIAHKEVATYADLAGVAVSSKPVFITCITDATYGETESLYYKTSTKLRKVALIDEN